MAIVKRDQIIQEAEKLAGRGKLDAAIKEYRRALDLVPSDTNTLNRLGDLLVKANRIPEAIEAYEKIAEHFSKDGFFLKAIAIYKKVNRLDPQRVEIYEQLADLYFKQGLAVEGRQQLLTLADWFLRSKQHAEAVRVFRRLVELEPSNLQARAKLVDLFVQLEDKENVAEEIATFGRLLLGRGMLDEAAKLYHRAVDLVPDRLNLVGPCLEAMVSVGRTTQAAELADRVLAAHPTPDVELAQSIARVKMEAGDLTHARRLVEAVLSEAGEKTAVIQLYGDLMLRVGDVAEAKEHMLPVVNRLFEAGDRDRASALVKRLLRSAPGDLQVLEQAIRVISRREDPDMAATLEAALADALLREGRREEATELYGRLSREDPQNNLFRQRLRELGSQPEAARVQAPPAESAVPDAEVGPVDDPASGGLFELEDGAARDDAELEFVEVEIPGDASEDGVAIVEPAGTPPAAPVLTFPPASTATPVTDKVPEIRDEAAPESVAPPGDGEELVTEALVFIKYGLTDKAVTHLHRVLAMSPDHAKAKEMLASLGVASDSAEEPIESPAKEVAPAEFESPRAEPPPEPPPAQVADDQPEPEAPAPPPSTPVPPTPPPTPQATPPSSPRSASSSSSFQLNELEAMLGVGKSRPRAKPPVVEPEPQEDQLGFDPASVLSVPEVEPEAFSWSVDGEDSQPPEEQVEGASSPLVEVPTGEEMFAEPETAQEFEPEAEEVELLQPAEELDVGAMLAGPGLEQLGEVDLFLQQGLLDDAAQGLEKLQEGFPGHPDVMSRMAVLKAKGWEEPSAGTGEATAEELFSEEEQFFDLAAELERELAEDEMVAEAAGSSEAAEESIEDLFKEFQRGVAEQIGEEDHDTHFNLGLAYREMGLLDEAIGEFQLASKSPQLFVECASMIAACYVDRGLPDAAAEWYQRALAAPEVNPEAEVGLRYELARSQEMAGNATAALGHYAEVLAMNPAFRDVVDRVSRLRSN